MWQGSLSPRSTRAVSAAGSLFPGVLGMPGLSRTCTVLAQAGCLPLDRLHLHQSHGPPGQLRRPVGCPPQWGLPPEWPPQPNCCTQRFPPDQPHVAELNPPHQWRLRRTQPSSLAHLQPPTPSESQALLSPPPYPGTIFLSIPNSVNHVTGKCVI